MTVPCGGCIGCRVDYRKAWTVRNLHELSRHDSACFLTLTYRDAALPHVGKLRGGVLELYPTLVKSDLVKFWKRCRSRGIRLRYFACGEYGDLEARPHYHAIVYGYDFPDRVLAPDQNGSKEPLYVSDELEELWPFGFHTIGAATEKSIEYVAGYVVKKLTGRAKQASKDPREGVYGVMSRNPGIGKGWVEDWRSDVYPSDSIVLNGFERRPPRFYDDVIGKDHPELLEAVKEKRRKRGEERMRNGHFGWQKLEAKKKILEQRQRRMKRTL